MSRLVRALLLVGGGLGAAAVPSALALPSPRTQSPKETAQASFQKGYRHQQAKRYEEAIQAYEESLRDDPSQAEALSNLGFCYKSLKRYQKAVGFYQDAIRLKPDLAEAHEYLGEAYLELGRLALAEREYHVLLTLDPHEAEELKEQIDAKQAGPGAPPDSEQHRQP
jgi:tetratricopeptide (TPR) repeat protein